MQTKITGNDLEGLEKVLASAALNSCRQAANPQHIEDI